MITKASSELRSGDVVNCHGMRCLIDRPVNRRRDSRGGKEYVYFTCALVLNRDEVPDDKVPRGFTVVYERGGIPTDEHRWTVQGNDLARWSVES